METADAYTIRGAALAVAKPKSSERSSTSSSASERGGIAAGQMDDEAIVEPRVRIGRKVKRDRADHAAGQNFHQRPVPRDQDAEGAGRRVNRGEDHETDHRPQGEKLAGTVRPRIDAEEGQFGQKERDRAEQPSPAARKIHGPNISQRHQGREVGQSLGEVVAHQPHNNAHQHQDQRQRPRRKITLHTVFPY